mmetsp:Transcript_8194/g.24407  ORF Transcript_8194/g.24407 Transcript_8194/m.24407 type:complete len:208 (+) Transcript_8194:572-1195(+)
MDYGDLLRSPPWNAAPGLRLIALHHSALVFPPWSDPSRPARRWRRRRRRRRRLDAEGRHKGRLHAYHRLHGRPPLLCRGGPRLSCRLRLQLASCLLHVCRSSCLTLLLDSFCVQCLGNCRQLRTHVRLPVHGRLFPAAIISRIVPKSAPLRLWSGERVHTRAHEPPEVARRNVACATAPTGLHSGTVCSSRVCRWGGRRCCTIGGRL